MNLKDIHINPDNPRIIKDERFKKLCKSIKEFPKMMTLRPIIIDNEGMILGGNMRFKALLELGYKEVPDEWVRRADELTDEEKSRFIIEDNLPFGEWDWEALKEWDKEQLKEWGMDIVEMINFDGSGKSGSSPWERIGEKNNLVLFKFGEIECNLDFETYMNFKSKCPDNDLAEYLRTIL